MQVRDKLEQHNRPLVGADDRERLLADLPVAERQLTIDGIPTAVLEGGEGPPIILLHGAGEFAATWMRVIPQLTRTHRVIAPDLPGHGASGLPDGRLESGRMSAWLGELIDRTCPSPPVVAGHLLGGSIGLRFACEWQDRVSSLVLVDTYGLARLRPAPRFALAMVAFVALPNERTQDHLFRRCFVNIEKLSKEMGETWDALLAYALHCARTPALKAALRDLMPQLAIPAIPPADLARLTVPTTLIWGRNDLQVRLRVAETASERYGWPLHVIEDAADDPAVEQPGAFLDALRVALEAVEVASEQASEAVG